MSKHLTHSAVVDLVQTMNNLNLPAHTRVGAAKRLLDYYGFREDVSIDMVEVNVLGEKIPMPYPQTMNQAMRFCATEEDAVELFRFGLHHRMRTLARLSVKRGDHKHLDFSKYIYRKQVQKKKGGKRGLQYKT